ncbi:Putative Fibrinogen-binding protein FbsA [Streptococcus agalactiae LADL-90-503]|nr:Putative Fibrinogen-binding protein FbsA [Streptococcus agalactiae LADL-90-503]
MFNKIGFRTWKSGKLWLYMGVLGSTIILGSSPVSAMDSVGNQSQGNVLERRQHDVENKSQVGQLIEKNPLFSKLTVSRENNHSSQGDSNKQSFSKKVSQVTNVANRPMLTNNSRTIPVINKLPKTGDDQNVIFKLVGFGLILLTSLFCGLRRNEN